MDLSQSNAWFWLPDGLATRRTTGGSSGLWTWNGARRPTVTTNDGLTRRVRRWRNAARVSRVRVRSHRGRVEGRDLQVLDGPGARPRRRLIALQVRRLGHVRVGDARERPLAKRGRDPDRERGPSEEVVREARVLRRCPDALAGLSGAAVRHVAALGPVTPGAKSLTTADCGLNRRDSSEVDDGAGSERAVSGAEEIRRGQVLARLVEHGDVSDRRVRRASRSRRSSRG